jgi:hypothetical protein
MKRRIARNRAILVVGGLLWLGAFQACSKPLDPPPAPPPTITQATFEPVYRASKAIQGATGPGVTYVKFGELLQGLSTEIGIAKDHQMNDLDKKLMALYDDALSAYKFSSELWKHKINASDNVWKGEIPVAFVLNGKMTRSDGVSEAELQQYALVPVDRKVPYTGRKYQALPAEAIQMVWLKADAILKQATEMYYGRSAASKTTTAPSK